MPQSLNSKVEQIDANWLESHSMERARGAVETFKDVWKVRSKGILRNS